MKYTLKQLQVFNAIAGNESVSRAAEELCMTQSAVSMSLAQLENLLDRPLFIRHGNRLTLSHWEVVKATSKKTHSKCTTN